MHPIIFLVILAGVHAVTCPSGTFNNPITYTYNQIISGNCTKFSTNGYINVNITNTLVTDLTLMPKANAQTALTIFKLIIQNNTFLTNITALPKYWTSIMNVMIVNNPSLTSCGDMTYQYGMNSYILSGNNILTTCNVYGVGDITDVYINGVNITKLSFPQLSSVSSGTSMIISQTALITLSGSFPTLTQMFGVSYLSIDSNPYLTSINGFESLTSVSSYVSITNNPSLINIDIPSLQSVGGLIINNNGVNILTGYNSLTSINTLTIINNPYLSIINAFNSITSISNINIDNYPLTTMSGFPSLTSVTSNLIVTDNVNVNTFIGLSKITTFPTNINFTNTCCPSSSFFIGGWNINKVHGCILCGTWTSVSQNTILSSGGVTLNIVLNGNSPVTSMIFRFGVNNVSCPMSNNVFTCISPISPVGLIIIEYSLNQNFYSTGLNVMSVSFNDYMGFQQSWSGGVNGFSLPNSIPGINTSSNSIVSQVMLWLSVSWTIFIVITFIILVIMHKRCEKCPNLPSNIRRLDILFAPRLDKSNSNNYGLVVRRRRTVVGGLITMLLMVVVTCVLIVYLTDISSDNQSIVTAYQPSDSRTNFQSNYEVTIVLSGYSGSCSLPILTNNVVGISNTTIISSDHSCKYIWTCNNCNLIGSSSLSVMNNDPNSLVHLIDWKISALDYFGNVNMVSGTVSSDANMFFKGTLSSSSVTINPSKYSNGNDPVLYGLLLNTNSYSKGTQLSTENFASDKGSGFILYMNPFSSTFSVNISNKRNSLDILIGIFSITTGCISAARFISSLINYYHVRKNDQDYEEAQSRLKIGNLELGKTSV